MYDRNSPLDIKKTICSLPTVNMIWDLSRRREDPRKLPPPRLLDVLRDSRLCQSTYPIDKVYGVLGLVCEEDASRIPIDYGIEAGDLYTKIAMDELERSGLDILSFCTKSADKSAVDCPSWVPDWSQPCYHQSFLTLGVRITGTRASSKFRVDRRHLIVPGQLVDTITNVDLLRRIPSGFDPVPEEEKKPDSRFIDGIKEMAELEEEKKKLDSRSVGPREGVPHNEKNESDDLPEFTQGEEHRLDTTVFDNADWFQNVMDIAFPEKSITPASYEAFWRTCCCNRTPSGSIPGAEFAESFAHWTKGMTGLKLRDFEEFQNRAKDFMESFDKYCDNRRFFRTREGRIGWGAEQVRSEDVVVVLEGVAVPFVLRPVERGFEVVGDAFVYGIMDGEAINGEVKEIRLA